MKSLSRIRDVHDELSMATFANVQSTGTKARDGQPPWSTRRVGLFRLYQFGYRPSRFCNKSCGLSIDLTASRVPSSAIREVLVPPQQLWGRGGAVHVRTRTNDVLVINAYFP